MHRIAFRPSTFARLALLVALLLASAALVSAAPDMAYKLSSSGPLPIGGDVNDFQISANGVYTVYRAGQDVSDIYQLYAVRTDGSQAAVRVSAAPDQGRYIREYAISPDNAHVVYTIDQDTRNVIELYSARLDGGGSPVKLNGPMVEGGGLTIYSGGFKISPDGGRVVYRADQDTDEVQELYSAPIDGGAPASAEDEGVCQIICAIACAPSLLQTAELPARSAAPPRQVAAAPTCTRRWLSCI